MVRKQRDRPAKTIWAYSYELAPPRSEDQLRSIRTLLDRAHLAARREARTWAGSIVVERVATHILIVSDSPGQDGEVNRGLEAGLNELNAGFSITAPMWVTEDSESS